MCCELLWQDGHQCGIVFTQPAPAGGKPFDRKSRDHSRGAPLHPPGPFDPQEAGQGVHRDIALPIRRMPTLLDAITPAVGQTDLLHRGRTAPDPARGGESFGAQLRRHRCLTVDALGPELLHAGEELGPRGDLPAPLHRGPRLAETHMAGAPHDAHLHTFWRDPLQDDTGAETVP
jgi:hypothetical protein